MTPRVREPGIARPVAYETMSQMLSTGARMRQINPKMFFGPVIGWRHEQ